MTYTTPRTPRCAFCIGTGLTIPTNHWMIDKRTGATICPRLLSTNCKSCGMAGHTIKKCPKLKEEQSLQREAQRLKNKTDFDSGSVWINAPARSTQKKPFDTPKPIQHSVGPFHILCQEVDISEPEELPPPPPPPPPPPDIICKRNHGKPSCLKYTTESIDKKTSKNVSWSMALKISPVPELVDGDKDFIWILFRERKQATDKKLLRANATWNSIYTINDIYEKTVWADISSDDDDELPDVHSMFKAEHEFRMRGTAMAC